jgi:hypothetical protein
MWWRVISLLPPFLPLCPWYFMNDRQRWEIFRVIGVHRTTENKTKVWTLLSEVEADPNLETLVIELLNKILAAEADPSSLLRVATTATGDGNPYVPGLKRADTVEFYEGGAESEARKIMNRLISDLIYLIGYLSGGSDYGFS